MALVVLLLIGGGFWAGRMSTGGAAVTTPVTAQPRTVEVGAQEVGRSSTLVTAVTREFSTVAANRLSGTILDTVEPGSALYEVDQIPVRAGPGAGPRPSQALQSGGGRSGAMRQLCYA